MVVWLIAVGLYQSVAEFAPVVPVAEAISVMITSVAFVFWKLKVIIPEPLLLVKLVEIVDCPKAINE